MFKKKMELLVTSLFILPVMAHASNLTLINNTNQDSTCVINNGACSTVLGPTGVTKAHSTNVVSEASLALACILNRNNCKADVYMTNNCTGPVIATAYINTTTGIKSVQMYDQTYSITGSGFTVTLDGGPAFVD